MWVLRPQSSGHVLVFNALPHMPLNILLVWILGLGVIKTDAESVGRSC